MRSILIVAIASLLSTLAPAQLRIQNTLETQIGKLPNESADPFPSLYDRLVASYRKKKWSGFVTVEQYHTKYDNRNYFALSQAQLRYKTKKWDVQLGNFYETLGRGLLMRSYEIRGSVLEDIGFRSRNYFHRDMLGGIAKYKTKKWSVKVLSGYSLNNVLPPTFSRSQRRSDWISSVEGAYRLKRHKLGAIYMHHRASSLEENYGSLYATGPFLGPLRYNVELTSSIDKGNKYALYAGVNGNAGALAYSLEYKRYRNFVLGSGINEPPALIKQQTYKVLNRSTHVTNPTDEEGYQLDLFYRLDNGSTLTFNHSLASNTFGNGNFIFRQYFLEWSSDIGKSVSYKVFADLSQDPFKGESDRISAGIYSDIKLDQELIFKPEVEVQFFNRSAASVDNQSYVLGLQYQHNLYVGLQLETTSDPFLIGNGDQRRYYTGGIARYKINRNHAISLFVGERRGGPLCSAGVCYEILDFKGVEVRWTSRW